MKCIECGGEMVTSVEPYRYFPGVTLLGIEISRCSVCGEQGVAIPRIEELHRAIALALISKSARLTSEEIRFLRKYLELSGVDFARMLHVDPSTVSRWERGDQAMGEVSDAFLRALVLLRKPIDHYPVEGLSEVAKEEPAPLRVALKPVTEGWEQATLGA